MDYKEVLDYYSRREIQAAILESARNREVAVRVGDAFAKRPDILQFPADVRDFARNGATSFHISEERWKEPLDLKPGLTKKQLDENRIGWDLVIDIDSPYWDFAKQTSYFVVELLREINNINCVGVKFSGNKGFHISVPFEAFPAEIDGINIKDYFPEGLKRIALYLQDKIVDYWNEALLKKLSPKLLQDTLAKAGKQMSDIMTNGKIDVLKFIEIDTVLISSRHMFRAPYSLHEKSGLVSLPIKPDEILFFDKQKAKPSIVKPELKFILRDTAKPNEASSLIIQAFDWFKKAKKDAKQEDLTKEKMQKAKIDHGKPQEKIREEFFPPCIKKILDGKLDDGKKRALFLLLKFLAHAGWGWEDIEAKLTEWNKTHSTPLRDNYIQEQISWHKKQRELVLPPNCDKEEYYKELKFCNPMPLCSKIKNPVNFAKIKASKSKESFDKKESKK